MATILIVDDAMFIRSVLRIIFEKKGYHVIEAINGLNAFEMYQEFQPDLVTMDITMPEFDGLYGLERILEYDIDAKVIMISAMEQSVIVRKAIEFGSKDYIIKPFNEEEIIHKVAGILK